MLDQNFVKTFCSLYVKKKISNFVTAKSYRRQAMLIVSCAFGYSAIYWRSAFGSIPNFQIFFLGANAQKFFVLIQFASVWEHSFCEIMYI